MERFEYCTGQQVWINLRHVVSIRDAEQPVSAEQPITLIRTADGEQFAVKGAAEDIVSTVL